MLRFSLFLFLFSTAFAKVSYEGYQVWKATAPSMEHKKIVHEIVDLHFLSVHSENKNSVTFFISPEKQLPVATGFAQRGIYYEVQHKNIQRLIDAEEAFLKAKPYAYDPATYNSFEDIEAHLTDVAASNANAELVSIGQTFEGREQWVIQFSTGPGKQVVWIDCGIHAREWISPASCLYGIDLLDQNDPSVAALIERYDVHIMPVYNPDGYVYTQTDRLWRKNRDDTVGATCVGVDLNRNFDDHFGGASTSNQPCSDVYHGPSAASEIETQNAQNHFLALDMVAMYSIHSYSQLWMYPYGYDEVLPPNAAELDACSEEGVTALTALYGTRYQYGPIATTIYPAAGTTVDWVYNVANCQHSYTLELRDTGTFGFLLPEAQIIPTCEETWAGLVAALLCI